jgi:hypothetical protein
VKFGLKTITGIFYHGPYVWELVSPQADPTNKIEELHEGGLLDHIFYPGISVSVSGNKFKVTRWGIGRLPTSGNSFVHVFIGKICRDGSKTVVRGNFRLNLLVFGFALFWLTGAYLISGALAIGFIVAYWHDGKINTLSGVLFGTAFPIFGTFMLLGFRRLAQSNEAEILNGLKAKFGEPFVKPE